MAEPLRDVTTLLRLLPTGDRQVREELFPLVRPILRPIALKMLSRRGARHLVETTQIIHDAFEKLSNDKKVAWENRDHYRCFAWRVIRQIVIDELRRRSRRKRLPDRTAAAIDDVPEPVDQKVLQIERMIEICEALEKLEESDSVLYQLVHMRALGGYSWDEICTALEISQPTAWRYWNLARTLLQQWLEPEELAP